jgi:hypothetical protein
VDHAAIDSSSAGVTRVLQDGNMPSSTYGSTPGGTTSEREGYLRDCPIIFGWSGCLHPLDNAALVRRTRAPNEDIDPVVLGTAAISRSTLAVIEELPHEAVHLFNLLTARRRYAQIAQL